MKIIKINLEKINPEIVKIIAKVVKNGGVVAIPFDTCYGLISDSTKKSAVEKVFKIKKRDLNRPISSVFKDLEMIKKYAKINQHDLKKYFPGPYTVILSAKKNAKIKTIYNNTISTRIPDFQLTKELSKILSMPYTSTSANISNQPPVWSGKEVIKIFQNQKFQPDLIIDGGKLPQKPVSKIIDLTNQTSSKIIER
jgi:L-threonylcarbamoyladenylate synthase